MRDSNRYRGGPPDPVNNRPNDSFSAPDDDIRMTPGYRQWEELNKQIKEWNNDRKEIFHLSYPDKVSYYFQDGRELYVDCDKIFLFQYMEYFGVVQVFYQETLCSQMHSPKYI